MADGLGEDARLGEVVGHERGVTLVHTGRGEGVPSDLLLLRWKHSTGEANKSRRRKSPA